MSDSPPAAADSQSSNAPAPRRKWKLRLVIWSLVLVAVIGGGAFYAQQKKLRLPAWWPRGEVAQTAYDLEEVGAVVTIDKDKAGQQTTFVYLGNKYVGGDDKLALVTKLPNVQMAYVENAMITDRGIAEIAKLKDLRRLHLTTPKVTDAGVANLAKLKNLQELYIAMIPMTDSAVAELTGLQNLTKLFLTNTKLTDAASEHLKKFPHLSHLNLYETAFTKKGIAALQKALPDTEIDAPENGPRVPLLPASETPETIEPAS